jgi:hypothetical protein
MDIQDLNDKDEKFVKKMQKDHKHFLESVDGLPVFELEKNITIYAKHREDTENGRRQCKPLNDAKELVSELSAPFNDALNALKLKLRYLNLLIQFKNGTLIKEPQDNE